MSSKILRRRRAAVILASLLVVIVTIIANQDSWQPVAPATPSQQPSGSAVDLLGTLTVKGRAPKTGYKRTEFGNGWATIDGCDTRNIILHRDMKPVTIGDGCKVLSGTLNDPYTGKVISFTRGADTSDDVQIDHVVALSDAWQKGAQQLTKDRRIALANDPLELLAVDGETNQAKGDGDAATWLPPNKAFRCQYVARQIAVKAKYALWVTQTEHDTMSKILSGCPGQSLPAA